VYASGEEAISFSHEKASSKQVSSPKFSIALLDCL
jgi:hypothetical protein